MARSPVAASEQGKSASSIAGAQNSDGGEGTCTAPPSLALKAGDGSSSGMNNVGSAEIRTIKCPGGDVYEGELKEGKPHGKGVYTFASGAVYDGEFKDGEKHGRGTMTWADGHVYEGEWKGDRHGRGIQKWMSGDVYDGEWKHNKKHGKGVYRFPNGEVLDAEWKDDKLHGKGVASHGDSSYDGEWTEGKMHGRGKMTYPSGIVYEGEWRNGSWHGKGTKIWASGKVYDGEWKEGKRHGKGAQTFPCGSVYEGEWVEGELHGKGTLKYPSGEICEGIWTDGEYTPNADDTLNEDADPKAVDGRGLLEGRKLRSKRSQQRRLDAGKHNCEHCGVDDYQYKLRVCSGCNLTLYCSAVCQKAGSRSHRRICDIASQLPSRDADMLVLNYDKDKMVDLDAGLRYATKYMENLKHLELDTTKMDKDDAVKLSAKQLSSSLRSKKGLLDSFLWVQNSSSIIQVPGITQNGQAVWKELHGLKQFHLPFMKFDEAQPLCDIIGQQEDTLMVLCLPFLGIDWRKAKNRRTIAQAVGSCKHLVKLHLDGCMLMDSDLKIMLHGLPNLRVLDLARDTDNSHEFTDNTCGLIARKCPGLQELSLHNHDYLSVRGIRKIFDGCSHLRVFCCTTRKLSSVDVQSLLDTAPQLMLLSLGKDMVVTDEDVDEIIEATGGRTVLHFRGGHIWMPHNVSDKTREVYEHQKSFLGGIWASQADPEVANVWAGMLEG